LRCKGFDKLIYLFLDGRLNQREKRKLQKHLSQCKRCQEKLSLWEAVEGKAKKIEVKEPPQEYWESFSSRVREKIIVRKERSPAVRFRKLMENILTFSPFKIKIAAGLVAVVLVFIIGKMYMEYHGGRITPPAPVMRPVEIPGFDTRGMGKGKAFPTEEGEKKIYSEKLQKETKSITTDETKEKAISSEGAVNKRETMLRKEKTIPQPKVAEEKAPPSLVPITKYEGIMEAARPSKKESLSREVKPSGGGMRKEVRAKSQRIEGVNQRGGTEKPAGEVITADSVYGPSSALGHYVVDKMRVPRVEPNDTLMQVDKLIKIIQVWKTYIEENPGDSLANQGYLQVAIGYYLLGRLTQDTTDISAGSKLIGEYLNQTKDPKIKAQLSDQLKKIETLRKR